MAACAYAAHPWPMELILVSALLEQEKELARLAGELRGRVETLRRELAALRGQVDADGPGDAV